MDVGEANFSTALGEMIMMGGRGFEGWAKVWREYIYKEREERRGVYMEKERVALESLFEQS